MKLLPDQILVTDAFPVRIRTELGLPRSNGGQYRLTDRQWVRLLELVGLREVAPSVEATPMEHFLEMFAHQSEGEQFLQARDGVAYLAHEMGLGKSRTVIEYLGHELHTTLIVCPKSVIWSWENEVKRWADLTASIVTGTRAQKLRALAKSGPWVINYESLRSDHIFSMLQQMPLSAVVFDEASRLKDSRTKTAKAARKLCWNIRGQQWVIPKRICLSGTPVTQGPLDLWSQCRMLQHHPLGFNSYPAMCDTYANMGGFEGKRVISYKNLPDLFDRFALIGHRRTKAECLTGDRALPAKIYSTIPVQLQPAERKAYKEMKRDFITFLEEGGEKLTAANILSQLLRLQQITSGKAGTSKLDALKDLLEDIPRPLVIWARFKEDVRRIALLADTEWILDGSTNDARRKELLTKHALGEIDVVVANARAGGMGVQLQKATTAIYFSPSFSLEERLQSEDRIHRIGQTQRVTIIDLVCRATVDEKVVGALLQKKKIADVVLDHPEAWA